MNTVTFDSVLKYQLIYENNVIFNHNKLIFPLYAHIFNVDWQNHFSILLSQWFIILEDRDRFSGHFQKANSKDRKQSFPENYYGIEWFFYAIASYTSVNI